MIQYRNVLFATDLSLDANIAFLHALDLAKKHAARLHIFHVPHSSYAYGRESSRSERFWTPAFAGVTGQRASQEAGNCDRNEFGSNQEVSECRMLKRFNLCVPHAVNATRAT